MVATAPILMFKPDARNFGIIAAMRSKVFISSVLREFAAERQMLAEYVRKDVLLGKFTTPQYKSDSAIFHTIIWRKTTDSEVAQEVAYQVAHQVVRSNGPGVDRQMLAQKGTCIGSGKTSHWEVLKP